MKRKEKKSIDESMEKRNTDLEEMTNGVGNHYGRN